MRRMGLLSSSTHHPCHPVWSVLVLLRQFHLRYILGASAGLLRVGEPPLVLELLLGWLCQPFFLLLASGESPF